VAARFPGGYAGVRPVRHGGAGGPTAGGYVAFIEPPLSQPRVAAGELRRVAREQVLDELDEFGRRASTRRPAPHRPALRDDPHGVPPVAAGGVPPRPEQFHGAVCGGPDFESHVGVPADVAARHSDRPSAATQLGADSRKLVISRCRTAWADGGLTG